jgi:hypothetical protein
MSVGCVEPSFMKNCLLDPEEEPGSGPPPPITAIDALDQFVDAVVNTAVN